MRPKTSMLSAVRKPLRCQSVAESQSNRMVGLRTDKQECDSVNSTAHL